MSCKGCETEAYLKATLGLEQQSSAHTCREVVTCIVRQLESNHRRVRPEPIAGDCDMPPTVGKPFLMLGGPAANPWIPGTPVVARALITTIVQEVSEPGPLGERVFRTENSTYEWRPLKRA